MSWHGHIPIHELSSWQHKSAVEIYPILRLHSWPFELFVRSAVGVVDRIEDLGPPSHRPSQQHPKTYEKTPRLGRPQGVILCQGLAISPHSRSESDLLIGRRSRDGSIITIIPTTRYDMYVNRERRSGPRGDTVLWVFASVQVIHNCGLVFLEFALPTPPYITLLSLS